MVLVQNIKDTAFHLYVKRSVNYSTHHQVMPERILDYSQNIVGIQIETLYVPLTRNV